VNISKTCSDVLFKNQEVFNATDEQVQGIKQINIAVSELDQATQENSSVAQETTAVAENLKEQSSKLSDIVESLNTLLGISSEKKKDKKVRQDQSGSANVFSFAQAKRDSTRKDTLNEEKQTEFEEVPEKLSKVSNDPWDQI
jgi:methyl-accepting chemotaxis protein-1 (serine sensor receptor)